MPKDGKNRRSGRDEARGNDLAGGLGGDEDYDWIKYLGEGRSPSSSATSAQSRPPSQAQAAARPAVRPAPLPQRVRPDDAPQRDVEQTGGGRFVGRGAGQAPDGSGRGARDTVRRGRGPDRDAGRRREAEPAGWEEQHTGYETRQPRQADGRPASGPVTGRAVKVRPGRTTGLLFNPHADDYSQPLYPAADDATAIAPPHDWQRDREPDDRQAPRRGERLPQRRLDTAEYARPLYPDVGAPGTGARSPRSWPDDDPRPAGSPDGPATDTQTPKIAPPVQPPARGKPARKPRKTSGAGARSSRPRGAKGRPAAGQPRSRAGRRVPVKVMVMLGSAILAALAVAGYVAFRPQASHVVSAPARLDGYVKQAANATANGLKDRIVAAAAGAVKNVVAAVYQRTTGPGTQKGPQVVVFIGGNLAGGASADSLISAYMARLRGAFTTSAGRLGGQAACAPGSNGGPAECAWADNDTFGVVVSATLNSAGLADLMRQMRPQVEHVVR